MNMLHTNRPAIEIAPMPSAQGLESFTPDADLLARNGVVGFEKRDVRTRPFNLLRSQVVKQCQAKNWKIIGVTSAEPGAGKSFITMNLAASLARIESMQVILLDLDLVRPTVASMLGLEVETGLSDYLATGAPALSSIGKRIEGTSLAVFPTRPEKGASASLLSGDGFSGLVHSLRETSGETIVICDLPPVLANDDAMIVAQSLDAYIAVADWGRTTRKMLGQVYAMLEPAPRIGTVLNRFRGGWIDPSGYSKDYSAYYY